MTQVFAVLAVFGMACLVWLAYGWLLLPGSCPIQAVVSAAGTGEGLEHTVKGLRWLRRTGLFRGSIAIRDDGLNHDGLLLALALSRQDGVEFWGRTAG